MNLSDKEKEELANLPIEEVASRFMNLRKMGANMVGTCPICGTKNRFVINTSKHIFNCFACCTISGKSAIGFLLDTQNMKFPEAVEYIRETIFNKQPTRNN